MSTENQERGRVIRWFSTNLRAIRLHQGRSQGDVASDMGVERERISELERGRHGVQGPTIGMLERVADSLGVKPSTLIEEPIPQTVTQGDAHVSADSEGSGTDLDW